MAMVTSNSTREKAVDRAILSEPQALRAGGPVRVSGGQDREFGLRFFTAGAKGYEGRHRGGAQKKTVRPGGRTVYWVR
jgi:hypothetical protein